MTSSSSAKATRCAAWHDRPDGHGTVPCVVIGHGFDGVREQRLDAYGERFAAWPAWQTLVFDYRHFGSSEGTPRQVVDNKRPTRGLAGGDRGASRQLEQSRP